MSEEWGPWVDHDGRGIPPGIVEGLYICVDLKFQASGRMTRCEGRVTRAAIAPVWWVWGASEGDVIRYRIRKPRGLTVLEGLLENLPEGANA